MGERNDGRWTASADEGVVLFMIGMRINKPWRVDKWFWVPIAMTRMLRYLAEHPECGLIRARNWFGRTTMQVGYWRSVEDVIAFASDRSAPHAAAWRRFNRAIGSTGAVGVWHETYIVDAARAEAVYVNMPPFGLGEATSLVPIDRTTNNSRKRLGLDKQVDGKQAGGKPAGGCPVHEVS